MFLGVMFITLSSIFVYAALSETLKDNQMAIIIIMFLCMLFMSMILLILDIVRRKLTVDRKINRIIEATARITQGDFKTLLTPSHTADKYDEYDTIMANINAMARELGKNEMLKSDFISNVSHEIKTPLAIIQNYAIMLRSDGITDAERVEYTDAILNAGKKLNDLVINILKLSRLENSAIAEPKAEISLGDLLGETVLQFEDRLDEKNISVECDLDDVTVYAVRSNLDILFSNLVSNAVKFSRDGGVLKVSAKKDGTHAVVSVEDNGIGMTEETGRHIFDKFFQGDSSHREEGNGLGMALVKRIIDVIGGEITVESELNKGSKFTVKFDTGMDGNGR